jgi:tetratricopeptide (TPR) repeat protein
MTALPVAAVSSDGPDEQDEREGLDDLAPPPRFVEPPPVLDAATAERLAAPIEDGPAPVSGGEPGAEDMERRLAEAALAANPAEAVSQLREVYELYPNDDLVAAVYADALADAGRIDEALTVAQALVAACDGPCGNGYLLLARFLRGVGDEDGALAALQAAAKDEATREAALQLQREGELKF